LKHTNVDALNKNPMGLAMDDNDFSEEIQDIENVQVDKLEAEDKILFIQTTKGLEWFGFRRHVIKLTQHHKCYFGINHWRCLGDHQLYMLDVVMKVNHDKELDSLMEEIGVIDIEKNEILRTIDGKQALKRKLLQYHDK
jgi:hypothetical protein